MKITMKIGFTGTRSGMTEYQYQKTWYILNKLLVNSDIIEAHHGDCIGADADFHSICLNLGIPVRGHPPTDPKLRAFCDFSLGTEPEKPYLVRNKEIVRTVDLLIATPVEYTAQRRGGTWYTIRYAEDIGLSTLIIFPGELEEHVKNLT